MVFGRSHGYRWTALCSESERYVALEWYGSNIEFEAMKKDPGTNFQKHVSVIGGSRRQCRSIKVCVEVCCL